MSKFTSLFAIFLLLYMVGCNRPVASSPTPDLFATLQASTPDGSGSPIETQSIGTPVFDVPGPIPSLEAPQGSIPPPSASDQLTGHIVFTCQLFKVQAMDQICIMNADGTGMRRLTTEEYVRHYYPSLAPDGQSVVYSSFREDNVYEIYNLDLNTDSVDRLTDRLGVLTAPEVSPDGSSITFTRGNPITGNAQIMVMDRNGGSAGNLPQISGWDPTWSPDGEQILYAAGAWDNVQGS